MRIMNDEMDTSNEEPPRIASSLAQAQQHVDATASQSISQINPPIDSNVIGGTGYDGANDTAQNDVAETDDENSESTYHLKWIPWNSGKIPIVMQSINGPCPLIATMNVLLLREKIKLPPMLEQITATQLLTYLGECLTDSVPDELRNDENALLNFEQNIHDAIEILPKLKTGLDVNIKFASITEFEYTPECIIFDILRIPLYHGWLSDPDFHDTIGNQSYNQLVDSIITNKSSLDPDTQARVLIAEEFLAQTASQLTIYGLNELRTKIKDNEIGILFRNNHFLTLFKRECEIYTLVTDHGYLTEDNIIWETLDNIEGAGRFFDSNFQLAEVAANSKQATAMSTIDNRQKQVLEDYLMALELEREDASRQAASATGEEPLSAAESRPQRTGTSMSEPSNCFHITPEDDFELAKRLQDEENRMFAMSQRDSRDADRSWAVMERRRDQNDIPIGRNNSLTPATSHPIAANTISRENVEPLIDLQDSSSFPPLISSQVQQQQQEIDRSQTHNTDTTLPSSRATQTQVEQDSVLSDGRDNKISDNHASEQMNSPELATVQSTTNQSIQDQRGLNQRTTVIPSYTPERDGQFVTDGTSNSSGGDAGSQVNINPESQSHDNRTIRVTATSSNIIRPTNDRARQRGEKNSKESTCIVH